jgi:HD superfamily phosphodiesterase
MTSADLDRTEQVRQVVDEVLRAQPDDEERRCGFVHLYGVALSCALLARVRGLDPELATVAGMLHDLWTYKTGDPTDHGRRGAPLARQVLSALDCFAADEIDAVCTAVARHREKGDVHGPYDELLKDADVLQHHLYNVRLPPQHAEAARLAALRRELGIEL